jgi:NDP-sugar pyrophosphorylase family protein
MPTLFELLQKEGDKVLAYPVHEQWLDVGRPDDLQKAKQLNISLYTQGKR